MSYRNVERRLRREGFYVVEGRKHRIYRNPDGRRVVIARSGRRGADVPSGTLRAIFHQAGWIDKDRAA
ncbi:MAG: type II toxin-antitoxin system HicA family toxin [Candidatus Poribacteria bacterium]|nr:type II toxin-antitoxin system HicA family toxin [Candidatus Poribacteria bacterium]